MRKLKLQVQITIDGFIADEDSGLDWMQRDWDDAFLKVESDIADSTDTLLMGRKMTGDFISHWENVVNTQSDSEWFSFAEQMVNLKKIVFSKTIKSIAGKNTTVENGDLVSVVKDLKSKTGKDILVYGGSNFVSNLLKEDLVDELYLFINPVILGEGLPIFRSIESKRTFELSLSRQFDCGVALLVFRKQPH